LEVLASEGSRRQYPALGKTLIVKHDASQDPTADETSIVTWIASRLPGMVSGNRDHSVDAYRLLWRGIEAIQQNYTRVIIFFDNFDRVTANESFPVEFFSFLRSLASNFNVAFITTSILELQELCVVKEVQDSPFFNIFTSVHLGMISFGDAVSFGAQLIDMNTERLQELVHWCGGSPYVLRLAASAKPEDIMTKTMPFERSVLPILSEYFEDVVAQLPAEAYRALRTVARSSRVSASNVHLLRVLIRQGFLERERESYRPFSPAFRSFLDQRLTRSMLNRKG